LIERFLNGRRAHGAAVNPDGKENGVHAAFAHAWDVDAAVGITLGDIEVFGEKALRRVIVSVEHDGGKMKFARTVGYFVAAGRSDERRSCKRENEKRQANAEIARVSIQKMLLGLSGGPAMNC
jgi:hypothetical protein